MKMCLICGGAQFAPGEIAGWGGKICHCEHDKIFTLPPRTLTEEDVRRIVRDEIKKINEGRDKNL